MKNARRGSLRRRRSERWPWQMEALSSRIHMDSIPAAISITLIAERQRSESIWQNCPSKFLFLILKWTLPIIEKYLFRFFSYDKTRGACKPVYLRRLCPDLLDDLLSVKDHLNLFSRRDDCRSVCTPELISTTVIPSPEPEESTNDMEAAYNENSFGGFELEWRGVNRTSWIFHVFTNKK